MNPFIPLVSVLFRILCALCALCGLPYAKTDRQHECKLSPPNRQPLESNQKTQPLYYNGIPYSLILR